MKILLLLTPLLLGAAAPTAQAILASDEGTQAALTPDEETRAVTLDITGMT